MRFRSLFAVISLMGTPAFAAEDPNCANHGTMNPVRWFSSSALARLPACITTYCDSTVNTENLKANIKHIDLRLAEVNRVADAMDPAIKRFVKACEAIHHDLNHDEGALMDEFRKSRSSLKNYMELLSEFETSLTTDPELRVFSDTGDVIERQYKNPACKKQINAGVTAFLDKVKSYRERANITCSKDEFR